MDWRYEMAFDCGYQALSDKEYKNIRSGLVGVFGKFWHGTTDEGVPRLRRLSKSFRRAALYRIGDTLYFAAGTPDGRNGLYVVPTDEYRFVEGDVNTMYTRMTSSERAEWYECWLQYPACEYKITGYPRFEHELTVGIDAPKPNYRTPEPTPVATKPEPKPMKVTQKPAPKPTPKKAKPRKATTKRKKAAPAPTVQHNPLDGVVNPRPQDKSGWKGTRKRRSCVTTYDAYDSAAGCLAIGAMFTNHAA